MPSCARKDIVDPNEVGAYHCISRCVRRAFLCGDDAYTGKNFDHRKQWIEELTRYMARYFAVDVISMSVMSNHLHQILRIRPDLVRTWSDEKVARHWLYLYPKRRDKNGDAREPSEEEIAAITGDQKRVQELRKRLSSLSWFNAYLKEKIARRANAEDDCRGHFWEARFKCVKLADESAVLACSIYVDLNPIRAKIAELSEQAAYTSAWYRIRARRARLATDADKQEQDDERTDERYADCWLAPLTDRPLPAELRYGEQGFRISDDPGLPIPLDQYLRLLDWTGRQVRSDRRGAVPADLADILTRLEIEPERWVEGMNDFGRMFRQVAGTAAGMVEQARKSGRRWFQGIGNARRFFKSSS